MLRLFFLICALVPQTALSDITFGPNPRALDNLAVFDTSVSLREAEWDALLRSGVRTIDLNATSIMRNELGREPRKGKLLPRHHGTFLGDAGLRHLRDRVSDGFRINYQAGIGLSADRCVETDPVQLGERAAQAEYTHVIANLHAAGIPVAEINVDGPFLRLLEGSRKSSSCAEGVRSETGKQVSSDSRGKSMVFTAIAVHHYMTELKRQVQRGQSRPPVLGLTINLPNWSVGPLPSASWPDFRAQLSDMLATFASVPGSDSHRLKWIMVDYPYCYLQNRRACGGAGPEAFVRKTRVLWDFTREINGRAKPPKLALIANDIGRVAACVPRNASPKFLVFRDYSRKGINRYSKHPGPQGFTAPQQACQIAQRDGPDSQFMKASAEYAHRVTKGDLARALSREGRKITVSRISFQSWGTSPMSNLWYINQIRKFAQ